MQMPRRLHPARVIDVANQKAGLINKNRLLDRVSDSQIKIPIDHRLIYTYIYSPLGSMQGIYYCTFTLTA